MRLGNFTNTMVLNHEVGEEFETLCGSEEGVLWEDSLEQFFSRYIIDVVDFEDNEFIALAQGETLLYFELFEGKEGSSYPAQHINFNKILSSEGYFWGGMTKISELEARHAFGKDQEVYLLHEDNIETLVEEFYDIEEHSGEFGVLNPEHKTRFVAHDSSEQFMVELFQEHEGHELSIETYDSEMVLLCKDCQLIIWNFYGTSLGY